MGEFDKSDRRNPARLSDQVERTLREYFGNPPSPCLDEVRRLVGDILLRNAELENKVDNFRKIVQQLEAYRDRYVDLYELAPVGYVTLDAEGYVQEINLAGSELLGKARDELIGFPLESYVNASQRAEFLEQIRRCLLRPSVLTFEVDFVVGTGRPITVHLRGVPVEPHASMETFCKIAITDITQRKLAEEVIKASEANYRAVFDTANDAIFVHDADTGAILDANQKATEMYGFTSEEFRQISVEAFSEGHPPYSQAEAVQWLERAMNGSPQLFAWKAKNKWGRIFWTEVNLKRTALNGVPRLLAIVRDISERSPSRHDLQSTETTRHESDISS